jgi:hypothetical protein
MTEKEQKLQLLWNRYSRIFKALNKIAGKVSEKKYRAVQKALSRTLDEINDCSQE